MAPIFAVERHVLRWCGGVGGGGGGDAGAMRLSPVSMRIFALGVVGRVGGGGGGGGGCGSGVARALKGAAFRRPEVRASECARASADEHRQRGSGELDDVQNVRSLDRRRSRTYNFVCIDRERLVGTGASKQLDHARSLLVILEVSRIRKGRSSILQTSSVAANVNSRRYSLNTSLRERLLVARHSPLVGEHHVTRADYAQPRLRADRWRQCSWPLLARECKRTTNVLIVFRSKNDMTNAGGRSQDVREQQQQKSRQGAFYFYFSSRFAFAAKLKMDGEAPAALGVAISHHANECPLRAAPIVRHQRARSCAGARHNLAGYRRRASKRASDRPARVRERSQTRKKLALRRTFERSTRFIGALVIRERVCSTIVGAPITKRIERVRGELRRVEPTKPLERSAGDGGRRRRFVLRAVVCTIIYRQQQPQQQQQRWRRRRRAAALRTFSGGGAGQQTLSTASTQRG